MNKLFRVICVIVLLIALNIICNAEAPFLTYTPYYGDVYFYTANSERYARINVIWNSAGISEFDQATDTYEQELVFYNYDNTAYATKCSAYQTNIPNPYLDTQLFDNNSESNLAIGTTSPTDIIPSFEYYFIYNLKESNGTNSMYKIGSQEGYYLLYPSTYTTFAESTAYLIPFKSGYLAPESRSWSTEIEPNDSTAYADIRTTEVWLSGTINSDEDIDYIRIYLLGNESIRFISPEGCDYDVNIYDSTGAYVSSLSSSSQEEIKYCSLNAGAYYLKIYSYAGCSETSIYRIIIE